MQTWPPEGLGRMYQLIDSLPAQLAESAALSGYDAVGPAAGTTRRLILCGMGGSAIAGDLVQPLLRQTNLSLTVWRDYDLPHWTAAEDLVLCCSYSGDTEESLSGTLLAGARGCRRVAITSGGRLSRLAAEDGFAQVQLPGGLPPRAALGYGLGALVRVLDRLGFCAGGDLAIEAAGRELVRLNLLRQAPMNGEPAPEHDGEGNISPGALARVLAGRVPIIYTAGHEAHGAGLRLKAQLNENSKVPASVVPFPELDHNDLVGWSLPEADRDRFVLLVLRGQEENERIARRVAVTCDLLREEFAAIHEIRAAGESPLARVLSLVQYGDYLSCHLARLNGVDPIPVDRIVKLKNALG